MVRCLPFEREWRESNPGDRPEIDDRPLRSGALQKAYLLEPIVGERIACGVGITSIYTLVEREISYSLVIATRGVCLWDEYKTAVASQGWRGKH